MKINISNLENDFIKNIQNGRIEVMPLINHGARLDDISMKEMLETGKKLGPLIKLDDLSEEE